MVDELARALDGALPRPHALGEIGLDGLDENAPYASLQEPIFVRQLALAEQHRLPVLLHVLRAHPRALEVVGATGRPSSGGVLHSCSASADLCKRWLALGFSISFSGAICDPKARRLRAAVEVVPLERLLVETDAPDQTPLSRRPARNEPAFLVEIVAALAQIRGESVETVARATRENALRLFDQR
jgi:TatD DNase family protein